MNIISKNKLLWLLNRSRHITIAGKCICGCLVFGEQASWANYSGLPGAGAGADVAREVGLVPLHPWHAQGGALGGLASTSTHWKRDITREDKNFLEILIREAFILKKCNIFKIWLDPPLLPLFSILDHFLALLWKELFPPIKIPKNFF